MTKKQLPTHLQKIFKLLPLGMDLPITGSDMERLTGLDVRTIREHIRQLIVDYGIPVCGGRDNKQGGYYIPQNETERLAGVLPLQKQYDQEHKRIHALMTAEQLKDELDIEYKTLQRWEKHGLKRYQPPLEDTRKIFYRVSDILIFLGVENGR